MQSAAEFENFRIATQPSERQRKVTTDEHTRLRERLASDPTLKRVLLSTFIQGSHRRASAIRGSTAHPCDVDIVAVTNLPRSKTTARHAHDLFRPFLEAHYNGRYSQKDRSWCITVDAEVTLDLVPTTGPESPQLARAMLARSIHDWSASDDPESIAMGDTKDMDWNRAEPIWIPDRRLETWEKTHPLLLIDWTAAKQAHCNGRFTHTVRAVKWWKRHVEPNPKYPRGYPLEHLVAECCPNDIKTVADGLTVTLETVASRFRDEAARRATPFLAARGVPEVNVMRRVEGADFAAFHACVVRAAALARRALNSPDDAESKRLWSTLLGDTFR